MGRVPDPPSRGRAPGQDGDDERHDHGPGAGHAVTVPRGWDINDVLGAPPSGTLLRMRRAVVVLVIVALVGGAIALVVTSRPDLNKTRDATATAWKPLVAPLTVRYAALTTLVTQVNATLAAAGEGSTDLAAFKVALARWTAAAKANDAKAMVSAANDLEARVGQLRAVLGSSARLTQTAAITDSKAAFEKTVVPAALVNAYNESVRQYQRTRESTAKRLVAEIFGYGPIPTFEPSLAV